MNDWKCDQCGICCKMLLFPLENKDKTLVDWLRHHKMVYVIGDIVVVKTKCKFLGYHNGKHFCKIEHNKPKVCHDAGEEQCRLARRIWNVIQNEG